MKNFMRKYFIMVLALAAAGVFMTLFFTKAMAYNTIFENNSQTMAENSQLKGLLSDKEEEILGLTDELTQLQEASADDKVMIEQINNDLIEFNKQKAVLENEIKTLETNLAYEEREIMFLNGEVKRLTLNENEMVLDKRLEESLVDMIFEHVLSIEMGNYDLFKSTLYGSAVPDDLASYFELNKNLTFNIAKISCNGVISQSKAFFVTVMFHGGHGHEVAVIKKDQSWKVIGYD